MQRNLLLLGFGYTAEEIAHQVEGQFETITGTTRNKEKQPHIEAQGFDSIIFDGNELTADLKSLLSNITHLVMTIAPVEADPFLALLPDDLTRVCPNLEWVGYLSTVGVYGDHDGAWVDETTEPKPVSERSIKRLAAEEAWVQATSNANIPLAIFRLSGIYGPGRNAFVNIKNGRSRRLVKPGQVFNRVHREDIGQAVAKAISLGIGGIYNISDDEPAPSQDVVLLAHELAGVSPPPETSFSTAELTPIARSFYNENKRISNAKSKQALGLKYSWPSYRDALQYMWDEQSWH